MSFSQTLFGGLIAVIVLYFVIRKIGFSNYWSSLLAGTVPVISYCIYSFSHGVSSDVLAIHLAVFIATTGVLSVFGGLQKKGEAMHWAPKLLLSFFVVLVFLMATFLTIAISGIPPWLTHLVMPHAPKQAMHTGFSGATTGQAQNAD